MKMFMSLLTLCLVLLLPALVLASDLDNPVKMQEYFSLASMVVALASGVANMTKTDTDNKIVNWIGKLVDFLALNWTVRK